MTTAASASNTPFDNRLQTLWSKYNQYKEQFHEVTTFSQHQDSECIALARLAEQLRERWNNSSTENEGLRAMLRNAQSESTKHKEELKSAHVELAEARAKLLEYMQMNARLQTDVAELQRQVDLVREVLQDENMVPDKRRKLAFLDQQGPRKPPQRADSYVRTGASVSMGVDAQQLDYDTTDDNLDGGRRRGSGKRRRSDSIDDLPVTTTETECDEGTLRVKRNKHLTPHGGCSQRTLRRSFSTPDVQQPPPPQQPPYNEAHALTSAKRYMHSVADLRSPRGPVDSWTGGAAIDSRPHVFTTQTVLRPESCDSCRGRILFSMNAIRCEDCGILCHSDCRGAAPLPCVPRSVNAPSTPKSVASSAKFRLVDLVPPKPPMVPRAVIFLVKEIESRGVDSMVGLYRVSGSECAVNALLVRLHTQRATPDLRTVEDTATLTSCLKKFLTNLKEPLIPTSSWRDFVAAAELFSDAGGSDADWGSAYAGLARQVDELMRPNHDTLAFLCLHLQRVADRADANKMTLDNVSKCLAPTIVGYSSPAGVSDVKRAHEETIKQEAVMRALLSMPAAFWSDRISYDSQPLLTPHASASNASRATKNTPELCTTMLGSLYGGASGNTPHAAGRAGAAGSRKKKIFASPWLH